MPDPEIMNADVAATGVGDAGKSPIDPSLARIVNQINAILERQIQGNPELESRKIQVLTTGSGDLRIEVDGEFYKRPSEIEDEIAKKVVAAALKEFNSGRGRKSLIQVYAEVRAS